MKKLLLTLLLLPFLLLGSEPASATCTTPCTKSQLTSEVNTNWPDNTAGLITPAVLRSTVLEILNSYLDLAGNPTLAWCLMGNATSSTTASYGCFTIGGLTNKATPATTDLLLIQDQAAAGALKYCTIAQCIAAVSSGVTSLNTAVGTITLLTAPQGRLTLQQNTPVMTTSQSAQTTLRYDCYGGNQVPYYTGVADAIDTITTCEVTDAMVSAASAGQVVSGQVYDAWWVHGGANRICLAMSAAAGGGGGWASDTGGSNTARGTGYSQLDNASRPYITNKNSITNCFNAATNYGPVSANQGTYLGTVTASANGQVSWTLGAAASGGTAAVLGVWNAYNRVNVSTSVRDSGATYTYTSATIRQARASTGMQVTLVAGLAEDAFTANGNAEIQTTAVANANGSYAIGLDTTTAFTSARAIILAPGAAQIVLSTACFYTNSVLGLHVVSLNQAGDGTNANIFDSSSTDTLAFTLRM